MTGHFEYIKKVVDLLCQYNNEESCYLNKDLIFSFNINDLLERGTADVCVILHEDFDLLEKSYCDLKAIDEKYAKLHGLELFASRVKNKQVDSYNLFLWEQAWGNKKFKKVLELFKKVGS